MLKKVCMSKCIYSQSHHTLHLLWIYTRIHYDWRHYYHICIKYAFGIRCDTKLTPVKKKIIVVPLFTKFRINSIMSSHDWLRHFAYKPLVTMFKNPGIFQLLFAPPIINLLLVFYIWIHTDAISYDFYRCCCIFTLCSIP